MELPNSYADLATNLLLGLQLETPNTFGEFLANRTLGTVLGVHPNVVSDRSVQGRGISSKYRS